MDFESAVNYLNGLTSYERVRNFSYGKEDFNLEKVRKFLSRYGVDLEHFKFVHVAGSKGKGTVSKIIAEYLYKSGKEVGLFSSPHVVSICERIWLNGANISKSNLADGVGNYSSSVGNGGDLTYFEVLFVVALKSFFERGVEWVVLEVGLGGRLDVTNIVVPEISVLTLVELEHTDILGETLEDIINEKAAIKKAGVPMVVGLQGAEGEVILRKKFQNDADVYFVEREFEFDTFNSALKINSALALKVLRILFGDVNEELFMEVLVNFEMPGHFEVFDIDGKIVVFDVAHTVESTKNLLSTLKMRFHDKKFVVLVTLLKDKDVEGIRYLYENFDAEVHWVDINHDRGVVFGEKKDPEIIFMEKLKNLDSKEVLVVSGSTYLVTQLSSQLFC